MSEPKKTRQHKLTDKLPVLAAIIWAVIGLVGVQLVVYGLSYALHFVMPVFPKETNPIAVVVVSALALFLYKLWYRPEYAGAVAHSKFGFTWVLLLVYAAFIGFAFWLVKVYNYELALTLTALSSAILAGCTEEVVFRGFMIPVMLKKKKSIILALLVSSAIFALVHAGNVFRGADPVHTVVQLGTSFCMGIFLGALFIYSGNIIYPMIIHVVHDIFALSIVGVTTENGIITAAVNMEDLLTDIPLLVVAAAAIIFVLVKKNKESIIRTWSAKWRQD